MNKTLLGAMLVIALLLLPFSVSVGDSLDSCNPPKDFGEEFNCVFEEDDDKEEEDDIF